MHKCIAYGTSQRVLNNITHYALIDIFLFSSTLGWLHQSGKQQHVYQVLVCVMHTCMYTCTQEVSWVSMD